jgi:cytidine deaminase
MNFRKKDWQKLSKLAWQVRDNAELIGNTKVGAAVYSNDKIFGGCNIEQKFRSHDIHAEVNAIGNMIANGRTKFSAILIAADRDRFTPCGACMDWIMQFGGKECLVGFQSEPGEEIFIKTAKELMPYYPE